LYIVVNQRNKKIKKVLMNCNKESISHQSVL
jgi:hypothetical protein